MKIKVDMAVDGSYNGMTTIRVMLQRGGDVVICEGIADWSDDMATNDTFDEWVEYAMSNEEGFSAIIMKDNGVASYYSYSKEME